jgi:hypothetical protein
MIIINLLYIIEYCKNVTSFTQLMSDIIVQLLISIMSGSTILKLFAASNGKCTRGDSNNIITESPYLSLQDSHQKKLYQLFLNNDFHLQQSQSH